MMASEARLTAAACRVGGALTLMAYLPCRKLACRPGTLARIPPPTEPDARTGPPGASRPRSAKWRCNRGAIERLWVTWLNAGDLAPDSL
jgi:hypothetical protein